MKLIMYKDDSIRVIDHSVYTRYNDNILQIAYKAGSTAMCRGFMYNQSSYYNNADAENLRLIYKYKFDKGESAKIACKLEYDRHTKELELKIEPLYTTAAERFIGTVKKVYNDPSELLKQLHWVISDNIGKFTEKFREYLLYKENRDNEFAIDSMEYFSRLKEKYEPAGLKVTIEKGDTDGYIIEINDPAGGPNDDDDNYIKFTTAPASLYTSDGYFREFYQQMETDIEEREFTDVKTLFQGIEMLVDGALAWRKLFIDCEKRYCEMTVASED